MFEIYAGSVRKKPNIVVQSGDINAFFYRHC